MAKEGQNHTYQLTCNIHRGKHTNIYIGKLDEIPSIIVYSKDKDGLKEKVKEAVSAYFEAFPDQRDIVIKEKCVEKIPVMI